MDTAAAEINSWATPIKASDLPMVGLTGVNGSDSMLLVDEDIELQPLLLLQLLLPPPPPPPSDNVCPLFLGDVAGVRIPKFTRLGKLPPFPPPCCC